MGRLAYTAIYALALPFIVARLIWRGHSHRLLERFGNIKLKNSDRPYIWVHSVSVGETIAAAPMVKALMAHHPDHRIFITTTTATGSARVKALFGDTVVHSYNPYDLPWFVQRFIDKTHPALCIVMETELWPNMLHVCAKNKVPVLIANARLSAKSAAGYQKFARLSKAMLNHLSHIAVQNTIDGQRFIDLGLPQDKLTSTGSIKFDISLSENMQHEARELKACLSNNSTHPIWIAASTHQGEDEIILAAHQHLLASTHNARLILVPRHPERFDQVFHLASKTGLTTCRRSTGLPEGDWQIMVGDTMGELLLLMGCADCAFIGGSLVPNGGHNMLEAAIWACPVVTGPHLFNFQEISNMMLNAEAMTIIDDASNLASQIDQWLNNDQERHRVGNNGLNIVVSNRGALDKLLNIADDLMAQR